jgi:hypothetical protein
MNDWLENFAEKIGFPDLNNRLSYRLPGSELNTLLLVLFRPISKQKTISELKQYYPQILLKLLLNPNDLRFDVADGSPINWI